MNNNTKLFRLGLFVIAAILLIIAAVVILVGPSLTKPKTIAETYFKYSISGLEVGSPVKFRGIQVGEVKEILLSTEAYPKSAQDVISNLNSVAVVRMQLNLPADSVNQELNTYIKEGLRTQTQLAGITGSLYISLEFLDPEKYPADSIPFTWHPEYSYIPSAPSLSNEVIENVKNFLAGLDEMDIEKYVSNTLPAINSLIVNLNRIAESINATTVQDIGTNLNTLLTNTDTKISEIDIQSLNELIGQLDVAAKNFGDMAQKTNTRKLVDSLTQLSQRLNGLVGNNQYEVQKIIANINRITQNLQSLSRELVNDPSALFVPPKSSTEKVLRTGEK
ncbi:MlaD family protein [Turicimonas muris]|uniref:ABC transporter substrate-binding protein n=1 Tax=Turicimonas muris TaxID=1796652 RepID=A0A227KPF8_9BURK|nr:MlaD family protein [Turicimonas muris]ANU66811.1 ABC transporter substrate-binding protein [Burkholderiales bacterium YL45]MBS4768350.1 MCE family protein [Burkholderiales bacterium]OXE50152.1 ABC transporter substrate-binding protein [Turicimonas muris]QQQ95679.1 MCE family protein [Turicimonas muris]